MTLLQIKYFRAVCDCGGVTQAANELHVSQPTISSAIKGLEREFNLHLFAREGKTLQLTREGEIFRELSEQVLMDVDNAGRIMKDLVSRNNQVRLGITPMLASLYMPHLYRKFKLSFPEVSLHVEEDEIQPLLRKLDRKELDMVIMRDLEHSETKYKKKKIADLEYVLCVAPEHPLADRKSVRAEDFVNEPLVGFCQDELPYSVPEALLQGSGHAPNVVYRSNQVATIMGMISSSFLSTLTFRAMSRQWPNLRYISLDPINYQEVDIFWRNDGYVFRDMRRMIQCLEELKEEPNLQDL